MTQNIANLYASRLTMEQHRLTCGYWYTVTSDSMAHTAFATRAGLDRWLQERGLRLDGTLDNEPDHCRIIGEYRRCAHLHDADSFQAIPGERSRTLSNGDYVEAILERGEDGIITVHTLNPNVRDRQTFDYRESRQLMS